MANQILTADQITKEGLRILHEKLSFVGKINRQYDKSFSTDGASIGDSIRIRKPAKFITREGDVSDAQDFRETNTQLTLTKLLGVDFDFSSTELTLGLDNFSKNVLEPAMAQLASTVEATALSMVNGIAATVSSSAPVWKDVVMAKAIMDQNLAPADANRCFMIDPIQQVGILDDTKGLFQSASSISKQYTEGYIGKTGGFDFVQSSRIPTITLNNALAGVTAGSNFTQGGTALTVSVLPADVELGTVFTVAGVYEVHDETKKVYATLRKFVVAEKALSGATSIKYQAIADYSSLNQEVGAGPGNTRLTSRGLELGAVSYAVPGTVTTQDDKFWAAQANQSSLTATGNAITFIGTAGGAGVKAQSVGFHKDAFTIGFADLVLPTGTDMASRQVYDGISLRFVRDFDTKNNKFISRLDVLFGYQILRQELAVRYIEE